MSMAPQPLHTHDLAIIGAGPAGMSAAITAQALGLSTVVLAEQPRAGGQIYRHVTVAPPTVARLLGPAAWWLPRWAHRVLPDVRFGHA